MSLKLLTQNISILSIIISGIICTGLPEISTSVLFTGLLNNSYVTNELLMNGIYRPDLYIRYQYGTTLTFSCRTADTKFMDGFTSKAVKCDEPEVWNETLSDCRSKMKMLYNFIVLCKYIK